MTNYTIQPNICRKPNQDLKYDSTSFKPKKGEKRKTDAEQQQAKLKLIYR